MRFLGSELHGKDKINPVACEMDRRNFLKKTGALLSLSLVGCTGLDRAVSQGKQKPNIVLLVADDMNYRELSCYGSLWGTETPHIDRLAEGGIRCTHAYVTAPTCAPSRAGLMTGRYQTRFGYEFNSAIKEGVGLSLSEKTMAERLKPLGYYSGIIGKWHLGGGGKGVAEEYHPLNRGFDEFYGFFGSMVHFYRSAHIWKEWVKVRESEYLTDAIARESCDFIERNRDKPFFLYVPFNAVHTPLEAAPEDIEAVKHAGLKENSKAHIRAAMLRGLDRAVGRILQALSAAQLEENTLIFFISDNGDYANQNRYFRGGKGWVSEGGIRVPFIVQWKDKLPAGKVYEEPMITLDILPTAIAAAGGKVESAWNLDGVDLIPFFSSGQTSEIPHEWLYWRIGNERAARHGKWKIYKNGGSGYGSRPDPANEDWALYDLSIDPTEIRDVKAENSVVFRQMLEHWNTWNSQLSEPGWPFGGSSQMEQL
jgi:arylsulfatase A-like enzyme